MPADKPRLSPEVEREMEAKWGLGQPKGKSQSPFFGTWPLETLPNEDPYRTATWNLMKRLDADTEAAVSRALETGFEPVEVLDITTTPNGEAIHRTVFVAPREVYAVITLRWEEPEFVFRTEWFK